MEDSVWLNCVGTYGISSAGYWWGRLAAAVVVRMIHYLIRDRWAPEALLFADDLLTLAGRQTEIEDLGLIVLILTSWGVPLKWGKFWGRGGRRWHGSVTK